MIKESLLSLNPDATHDDLVQYEQNLRKVKDRKQQYYIIKFTTKFAASCIDFPKYTRDEFDQQLKEYM